MHTRAGIMRHRAFALVVPFVLVLALALAACGTNTTTTGAAPTASAPVVTATATQSQATKDGCPNSAVVANQPAANVVLTNADSGTTVNAQQGNIIEVNLPFGHNWQGPLDISQGLLTIQGPAGYASASAKACIWRFLATATGTAHLAFAGRPICQKNQACPMYVMAVPFTIDIK